MLTEPILVSPNQRYLMTASGQPFFWMADTAWELFHYLTLSETEQYLKTRREQGFNVIQTVILAEIDGPNAAGHLPLLGDDPTRPNEYYFRHIDAVIEMAEEMGMYIGLLPTWGDKVYLGTWGSGPLIFNPVNAREYGLFLGRRYRQRSNILWILGGDRPADGCEAVWEAMAQGITEGLQRRPFMTFHPNGGFSSSAYLHTAPWLDMNMLQSGHVLWDTPNWKMIRNDYDRLPTKPVLDGEPSYEDHPVDPFLRTWQPEYGRFSDYDARKQAYRAVFAGACGHSYGHHSVWQFWAPERKPINFAVFPWQEAILRPGAAQMFYLKTLMLSRPYFTRVPAQELLGDQPAVQDWPLADLERTDPLRAAYASAIRCSEGTHALVYFPQSEQTLTIDIQSWAKEVRAAWYDPRNGRSYPTGDRLTGKVTLTSPLAGPDWVLILDRA